MNLFSGKTVWVHTPSVGEFHTVEPLLKKLKELNNRVILTYSSPRAGDYLKRTKAVDAVEPMPPPLTFFVNRFVKKHKPDVLLIVESDRYAALYSAPVPRKLVLNARISERSLGFTKFLNLILGKFLNDIDLFICKSEEECKKFKELGVDEKKLRVCGNLKIVPPPDVDKIEPPLKFPEGRFIFTAGSTHEGEEGFLIEALKGLFEKIPNLTVVVAPRHTTRAKGVFELFSKSFPDKRVLLRSGLKNGETFGGDILIVDTLGELLGFYKVADVAFVGGTVNPKVGGHNLLEPAYFGKPVVFGKHTQKVEDLAEILQSVGLGFEVSSPEELVDRVLNLRGFEAPEPNPLRWLGETVLRCYLNAIFKPSDDG